MEQQETDTPWTAQMSKYFAQGFLFSLLFIVLAVVWVFLVAVLIMIGFIIGLIIGFLVLLFLIAGLNSVLTGWIWHVQMRLGWKALLVHGLILFIALIVAHIPAFIVNFAVPSLATTIVLFIVYCFIDGFISRKVAGYYEATPDYASEAS
jgi:hypothetical protein